MPHLSTYHLDLDRALGSGIPVRHRLILYTQAGSTSTTQKHRLCRVVLHGNLEDTVGIAIPDGSAQGALVSSLNHQDRHPNLIQEGVTLGVRHFVHDPTVVLGLLLQLCW